MKNKSKLKEIIGKANSLSAGEIMAAVNRGDEKIDGAEVLEKPYQSQAQARYIHAKAGEGKKWAKTFVTHSEGQPVGELPEKVEKGLKSKIATGIAGATMILGGTAQASNPSPQAGKCQIGHQHNAGTKTPSGASWSNTGRESQCHTHKDGGHLKPISSTVTPENHVFDKDAHSRKNITMTKAIPPPPPNPDTPNPNDPYYQMGRNMARPAAKKVPTVTAIRPSGIKQGWLDHAYAGVSRPMETIKKAEPEIGHTEPVAPTTKEKWAKQAAGQKSHLNPLGQGKEGVYRPGHHEWNAFVDHLTSTPETAESGVHDARWFAATAARGLAHHDAAKSILGEEHFPTVFAAAENLHQARIHGEDPTPHAAALNDLTANIPSDNMQNALGHINSSLTAHTKATNHMNKVGIPEEHHDAIFSSAATWEPTVKKSLVKSVLSKLKKAMPTPKEDKQEAGEASPSLDRVTEAPKEGDTRPFIDTKATFKQLKERHAIFKKKIQQDREDGDADATAIYSMNEADVTKPLEKSSAPSYKTLRTAKLPDGKKVNVYGNNGYERISNGPHRGRYLHSIMAEHKLGRKLTQSEEIDHKNGDRKSNGLSNLRLTTTSKHAAHTNTERAKQGGFTGEKRYMHSREYTEGKPESMVKADLTQVSDPMPENMEKGLHDYTSREIGQAKALSRTTADKQSPQYKGAVKGIVDRMKARSATDALSSHEVATDFAQAQREGKAEDPKGTGAPAWQKPMNKAEGFNPDNMFTPEMPTQKPSMKHLIGKFHAQKQNEKVFADTVNELKNPPQPQSDKPDLSNFTAKYRMRKSKK